MTCRILSMHSRLFVGLHRFATVVRPCLAGLHALSLLACATALCAPAWAELRPITSASMGRRVSPREAPSRDA
jgi:hypothetical protein